MSKGFQQFGATPLMLRYVGIDADSEQARQVSQALQGQIGQFYAAVRQQIDLSSSTGFSQSRRLPGGGVMHYKNNFGLETLDIKLGVARPEREETAPDVRGRPLPDFCVVDFVIPGSEEMIFNFRAVGISPDQVADTQKTDLAQTPGDDPAASEWFRYARGTATAFSSNISNRVSSLLFDLRRGGDATEIIVDIYARNSTNGDEEGLELGDVETPYPDVGHPDWTYIDETLDAHTYLYLDGSRAGDFDGAGAGTLPVLDGRGNPVVGASTVMFPNYALSNILAEHLDAEVYSTTAGSYGDWDSTEYLPEGDPLQATYAPTYSVTYHQLLDSNLLRPEGGDAGHYPERERVVVVYADKLVDEVEENPDTSEGADWFTRQHTHWRFTVKIWDQVYYTQMGSDDSADVVYGFYYNAPKMYAGASPHPDGGAIWSTTTADPADRRALDEAAPIPTEGETLGGLYLMGRLRVERSASKVEFSPA